MPTISIAQSVAFLSHLFRFKPPEQKLCLWTTETRKSIWVNDPNETPTLKPTSNWYFGLGTCKVPPPPSKRLTMETVEGLPGLWCDFDIQGPTHKRSDLPANYDDLEWIISEIGLEPSIIVNSGYGYHAYWQFSEWETDIPSLAVLIKDFQGLIRAIAKSRGWWVDATHDLARVLRLPGTLNMKAGGVGILCEVVTITEALYTPQAIRAHIAASDYKPQAYTPTDAVVVGNLVLNLENPQPPFKLHALLTNDDRFSATWVGNRPDLADQSPSGFDMAIANALVRAGWTDQEVCDGIIAARLHRSMIRNDDNKPKSHALYYETAIRKARESIAAFESKRAETESAEAFEAEMETPQAVLKKYTGLDIVSVEQFGSGEDAYFILNIIINEIPVGIRFGSASDLISRHEWPPKLYQFLSGNANLYKEPDLKKWKAYVVPKLMEITQLIQDQNLGILDIADECLDDYIERIETNRDYALKEGISFKDDSTIYLHLPTFHHWLKTKGLRELPRQRLAVHLRTLGWKPEKVGKSNRRYWVLASI